MLKPRFLTPLRRRIVNVVWCYKLGLSIKNNGDSALQLGFAFAVPVPPSLLVVPVVDNTLTRF